jgi:hypothetical protein
MRSCGCEQPQAQSKVLAGSKSACGFSNPQSSIVVLRNRKHRKNPMKTFFVLFFSLLFPAKISAQNWAICDEDKLKLQAYQSLPKDYTLLRSYRIANKCHKLNMEICLMSRDITYTVRIAGDSGGWQGIIVCLLDENHKELLSSNINHTQFNGFTFRCKKTGVYYLYFTFQDSQSVYGGAVLGFKR